MYGADCNMSTIVIRSLELLVRYIYSPLGAYHHHQLYTKMLVLTKVVFIVAVLVQVKFTGVPSYSVPEGVTVRVMVNSWRGGTDIQI